MPNHPKPVIRDVLLTTIAEEIKAQSGANLQQTTVLQRAARALSIASHGGDSDKELALLAQWQELFRTGLLGWGHNLSNPNPPFFHLTERGMRALANATRDPSNPAGYLRHLDDRASLGPVARSYVIEALDCYVAGLFKASAVMVGAAAEAVILELRDVVEANFATAGRPVPATLTKWQIKNVTEALTTIFRSIDDTSHHQLRARFDMYWTGFTGQVRTVRNEAGHPVSIEPVTADTVHASLLIFPELAGLATGLQAWAVEVCAPA